VSEEDEAVRTAIWRYLSQGQAWEVPGAEHLSPNATAKQLWRTYCHHMRMARRADRAAAERGITWTQKDALAEAERLTRLDVERCHVAAKRRNAAMTRRAMGRRTVRVIDRATTGLIDVRPLILWWRRGEPKRSLTGWDDGHVWTVKVPSRLSTAREALDWLRPDGLIGYWQRQGEWFFVRTDPHTAALCYKALEDGEAIDSEGETEAGTWHETTYQIGEWTNTRHRAFYAVVAQKSGEVAFIGRGGRVRTHKYTGKPRLYVLGTISAPDHEELELEHWYEVLGSRAVGAPAATAVGLD
jgi:hypothetical protein